MSTLNRGDALQILFCVSFCFVMLLAQIPDALIITENVPADRGKILLQQAGMFSGGGMTLRAWEVQAGADPTWSHPTYIENVDGVVALTRSQNGTVHLVGVEDGIPQTLVHLALPPGALTWSTFETIAAVQSGGGTRSVDVITTTDGRVHVVWDVAEFGQRWVQYAVRAVNGNWSTPEILSDMVSEALQVSIVTNGQNRLYVSWWSVGGSPGYFYRQQNEEGTWLSIQQIDAGAGFVSQQQTLVDQAGNVHFFWNNLSGVPQIGGIYHRTLLPTGVWLPINKVSVDLFAPSAWTSQFRAVAQANELYLVWGQRQITGGDPHLYYANTNNGTWSAPQLIEDTTRLLPGFLEVVSGDWFVIGMDLGQLTLLTRINDGMWFQDTPAWANSNGITAVVMPDKSLHLFIYTTDLEYRYRDPAGMWADGLDMGMAPFSSSTIILEESIPFQYDLVWYSGDGAFYSHSAFVFPNQLFLPVTLK